MTLVKSFLLTIAVLLAGSTQALSAEKNNISDAQENKNFVEELVESTKLRDHQHCYGSFYDWGRGQNGWGYCYQWTCNGYVLNGGKPVGNYYCEQVNPSRFDWGRGNDGWGYCYQWTPYGVAMNEGRPMGNYECERYNPSYYSWGKGMDGYTYCYQRTPYGAVMNGGKPVSNYYCGY